MKWLRRQAERRWRKSGLTVHRETYREQCSAVNTELNTARTEYYHTKLSESQSPKETYKIGNNLLFPKQESALPSHESVSELAEKFADFFSNKIEIIRSNLEKRANKGQGISDRDEQPQPLNILTSFRPATEAEISKFIRRSATKSCDLDPIPTWLLKICLVELLPVITHIVNLSLSTSAVPSEFKVALVIPLLKKILLDPEIFKNFRPVSNLTYISKLIERVVADRLNEHLDNNNLQEVFQSAYKNLHSTETALTRVQNDLLKSIDSDGGAILVLLDLSAAFDTIDHSILLARLHDLGVRGAALEWFRSYISDRKQSVYVQGQRSQERDLPYGVPQGSVLGPILFSIYIIPLGQIARSHGLKYHLYADDKQMHIAFKPSDPQSVSTSVNSIETCSTSVIEWLTDNKLKCNGDKTELLVILNKNVKCQPPISHLTIDEAVITPSDRVRNLGAIFDSSLDSESFINAKCKSAIHSLRNISRVRRCLTREATKTLVHAYVTSKLDYCNGLLYGVPSSALQRLQRVQNYAARVISRVPKYAHITPVLSNLHWLPVKLRINFKILVLVYKSLHGLAPRYLADLLQPYTPVRSLRSADQHILQPGKARLRTYGERAFEYAGPKLWNNLPLHIKTAKSVGEFKRMLKTHFFKSAFEHCT